MTTVLVSIAVAVVLAAAFGYVGWRDRRRLSAAGDPVVVRAARAEGHRRAAEWEHAQHDGGNNGGHGLTG